MIQIRLGKPDRYGDPTCYFNGKRYKNTYMTRLKGSPWELSTDDRNLSDLLLRTPIAELKAQFLSLQFTVTGYCHPLITTCIVDFPGRQPGRIYFVWRQKYEAWREPFTVAEFLTAIEGAGKAYKRFGVKIKTFQHDYAAAEFSFALGRGAALLEQVKCYAQIVGEILDRVRDEVHATIPPDSLLAYFAFPEETRAACTQYLAYFTQFLRDLGIDAASHIGQDTHRVLFTVTPTSSAEALNRVREALVVYLGLASAPNSLQSLPNRTDPAVAQLEANIHHLRSQIELSHAVISMQKEALVSLTLTNLQHQSMTYNPKSLNEPSDSEPLIGNFVGVTKFRMKGLEVNFAAILRKLKRVWRG